MTIGEDDLVVSVAHLSVQRLHRWIRLGWVKPERHEGAPRYGEADVARVRFLHTLEHEAELDEDTVPLLLSLVDQIHGLRAELRALTLAVEEQPDAVRDRIRNAYRRIAEG